MTRSASRRSRRTSSTSGGGTPSRRAAPCRSAGSSRSRTRRSSGSARTASTSCGARSRSLRDACRGTRAQVKWHDPAATFAEGIASRGDRRVGRVIERVLARRRHVPGVERALRARPLVRRDARRGARPGLVRDPAPHRRRGPARGTTSPPGCTRTSSGRTGKRPWPSTGSPIAGGRRATTAGCAPTTRSSTWWPRRCRRPAAARARARTWSARGAAPVRFLGTEPGGGAVMRGDAGFPVRLRYTKRGKVRWISHRDVARALERAFRITELPLAFTRGLLAPPEGELRARAVDRARERCRVPRPRVRSRGRARGAAGDR